MVSQSEMGTLQKFFTCAMKCSVSGIILGRFTDCLAFSQKHERKMLTHGVIYQSLFFSIQILMAWDLMSPLAPPLVCGAVETAAHVTHHLSINVRHQLRRVGLTVGNTATVVTVNSSDMLQ